MMASKRPLTGPEAAWASSAMASAAITSALRMPARLRLAAAVCARSANSSTERTLAALAASAASVRSVELFADLAETAAATLKRSGILNAEVIAADAAADDAHTAAGPVSGRFDAIIFTAALPVPDPRFEQLLTEGGRMVATVGKGPAQETLLITRTSGGEWVRDSLFDSSLDPLLNARQPARFVF